MKPLVVTIASVVGFAGTAVAHTNPTADLSQFVERSVVAQPGTFAVQKIVPATQDTGASVKAPIQINSLLLDRG